MTLSTNFPWHKQLDFSVYCGYYMCEHLRVQGRYTTDLERDNSSRNKGQLHGFSDLCHFIMHEVINPMATFYSKEHELATDSIYLGLCEWENKKHRVSSSSVGLQDRQVRSAIVQRHRCTVVSAWARLQAGGGDGELPKSPVASGWQDDAALGWAATHSIEWPTRPWSPLAQCPNPSLAMLGGRGPSSSRSGVPSHHHEALPELRTGDIVSTNESEKASTATPESLVSVLAAANGFTRCACTHVLGLAHVNARELLINI